MSNGDSRHCTSKHWHYVTSQITCSLIKLPDPAEPDPKSLSTRCMISPSYKYNNNLDLTTQTTPSIFTPTSTSTTNSPQNLTPPLDHTQPSNSPTPHRRKSSTSTKSPAKSQTSHRKPTPAITIMGFNVQHQMHQYTVIPKVLYVRRWGLKRWSLAFGSKGRITYT